MGQIDGRTVFRIDLLANLMSMDQQGLLHDNLDTVKMMGPNTPLDYKTLCMIWPVRHYNN